MDNNNRRRGRATVRVLGAVGLGGAFGAIGLVFAATAAAEMVTAPEVLDAPRGAGVALAGALVAGGLVVLLVGILRRPVETAPTPFVDVQEDPASRPVVDAAELDEDLPTFIIGLEPPFAAAS